MSAFRIFEKLEDVENQGEVYYLWAMLLIMAPGSDHKYLGYTSPQSFEPGTRVDTYGSLVSESALGFGSGLQDSLEDGMPNKPTAL